MNDSKRVENKQPVAYPKDVGQFVNFPYEIGPLFAKSTHLTASELKTLSLRYQRDIPDGLISSKEAESMHHMACHNSLLRYERVRLMDVPKEQVKRRDQLVRSLKLQADYHAIIFKYCIINRLKKEVEAMKSNIIFNHYYESEKKSTLDNLTKVEDKVLFLGTGLLIVMFIIIMVFFLTPA